MNNNYMKLTEGLDIVGEINRVQAFTADQPIGSITKTKVLICSSDRVTYDPPAKLVELDAKVVNDPYEPSGKRIAIICPRYPVGGICPGVKFGGLWMLSPDCLRPMPKQKRFNRR